MTSRVPRKLVGRSMADSMGSSVDGDDNSLDGRNHSHSSSARQSVDYANVYHSPTVPRSEEKPRRRSSTRPAYGTGDLMNHFNGSDPVRLELTRLENEVRGKERFGSSFSGRVGWWMMGCARDAVLEWELCGRSWAREQGFRS